MNEISNMTPMEQLIHVMTKDITAWVEEILYVDHNYFILILQTGEYIHFTKTDKNKPRKLGPIYTSKKLNIFY